MSTHTYMYTHKTQIHEYILLKGFLVARLVKNLACNAGDPSSIPGSGRSPGKGIGYPLHYSWTSLVAHMVKNSPAVGKLGCDL